MNSEPSSDPIAPAAPTEPGAAEETGAPWDSPVLRAIFAFSMANLNLIPLWRTSVYASSRELYFVPTHYAHDYAAILTLFMGLAFLLFGATSLVRRAPAILAPWLILALLAVSAINPLFNLRIILVETQSLPDNLIPALLVVGGVLGGAALWRWKSRAVAIPFILVVVLAPIAVFNLAQSAWRMTTLLGIDPPPSTTTELASPAHPPLASTAPRILWIIFDEFDARALWREPAKFDYPEVRALRERSIYASHVVPAGESTLISMPSLWLGEPVASSRADSPDRLLVQVGKSGEKPSADEVGESFRDLDHIYRKMHAAGHRIGLAGFYHPYCRLFDDFARHCVQYAHANIINRPTRDFGDSLRMSSRALSPSWRRKGAIDNIDGLMTAGLEFATDPSLDFITLHLNVPHPPVVFDPKTESITPWILATDYRASMAHADRLLGEVVRTLRRSQLGSQTYVIVTSDHGYRAMKGYDVEPGAVPLFVTAPDEDEGTEIDRVLSGRVVHSLIIEILSGRVSSQSDIADWIRGYPQ